jgi:hypothetical protein
VISKSPRVILYAAFVRALGGRNLHGGQEGRFLQLLCQRRKIIAGGIVAKVGQDIEDPVVLHAEFSSG